MVTQVDAISTPPTPANPPAVFEERAAQVWSDLARAVPQMNAQALENNAAADEADQAKNRAIAEADLAMGYRNAAQAAALQSSGFASDANAAKQAAEQAREASVEAKDDAERARDQAQGYADGMGQFIAMAATFTEVPLEFQAWMIAVTQPHLRIMVWDSAQNKYIRAPWHAPGQLSYFLRNVPAGYVEVRSDVVLNAADFPDLAEYLGVTGATFVLDETRGEFLRTLDSGRGKDAGRVVGSHQGDAGRNLTGSIAARLFSSSQSNIVDAGGGAFVSQGNTGPMWASRIDAPSAAATLNTYLIKLDASVQWPTANEFRVTNRAYRLAVQY